jgi:DNA-binding PadR family transcriptional regulator
MSLPEWLVLVILSQQAAHGFAVAQLTAPGGELGRVWQIPKAVVYRAIGRLVDADLIAPEGTEPGQGPQRTVYTATAAGRAAAGRWLHTPVEHVRDIRSHLLLKLALLDRAGGDPADLLEAQRAVLEPIAAAIEARHAASAGFDATLLAWRRATAVAALDFIDRIRPPQQRLAPFGDGEEALLRVVVGGQPPPGGRGRPAQRPFGERLVGGQSPSAAGGEGGAPGRVEEHQQAARPGHPGELAQARLGVRQVVDEAGREDRVGRRVRERQRAGVGQDDRGVRGTALRPGRREHLGGQVDGDDRAAAPDRLAQRRQRPAGPAADVDGHPAWPDARLGDRRAVRGQVVAELGVPGRGPAGEERLGLGDVPLAARAWRSHEIIMPTRKVTTQGRKLGPGPCFTPVVVVKLLLPTDRALVTDWCPRAAPCGQLQWGSRPRRAARR